MSRLPKAPLQEVIFEVKWDLPLTPDTNVPHDPSYETGVGLLKKRARELGLVHHVRKVPQGFPDHFLAHQTVHQFWSGPNLWPVVQLGPGILTINETDSNYDWLNRFYPLVVKTLEALSSSYEERIPFNNAILKYIDTVSTNSYEFQGWVAFLTKYTNFRFENRFNTRGELKAFGFEQIFDLKDNKNLQIVLSTAKNNITDEDIFVWQTSIIEQREFEIEDLKVWAQESHGITREIFKEICSDELYRSFQ